MRSFAFAACLLTLFRIILAQFLGTAIILTFGFFGLTLFNAAGGILCLRESAAGHVKTTGQHQNSRTHPDMTIQKQPPNPLAQVDLSPGIARSLRADLIYGVP